MKTCARCKQEKNREQFSRNKTRSDGLAAWCHDCHSAYQRKRKANMALRDFDLCRSDEQFGLWIKAKRMKLGLTVAAAALLARMETARLHEIEAAREKGATARECLAIARALGIDASEVIRQAGGA